MNCAFCDAPVAEDAERCPSCSALLRRKCAICGKFSPVHFQTCIGCSKPLPPLPGPAAPKPLEMDPPNSTATIILRLAAVLLAFLGLFACLAAFGQRDFLNSLESAFTAFVLAALLFSVAQIRDLSLDTWKRVKRIEEELAGRSRRR